MYRIALVSWEDPDYSYGYLGGVYADEIAANMRADAWNAECECYDDRRAEVVEIQ